MSAFIQNQLITVKRVRQVKGTQSQIDAVLHHSTPNLNNSFHLQSDLNGVKRLCKWWEISLRNHFFPFFSKKERQERFFRDKSLLYKALVLHRELSSYKEDKRLHESKSGVEFGIVIKNSNCIKQLKVQP